MTPGDGPQDAALSADALALIAAWGWVDDERFQFSVPVLRWAWAGLDWLDFRSAALAGGSAEPRAEDGALVLAQGRPEPPAAEVDGLRRVLLDRWRQTMDPRFAVAALEWATRLGEWAVLSDDLMEAIRDRGLDQPGVRRLFAGLPPEARRANPTLTWAWAAASAGLVGSGSQSDMVRLFLADAVALHADWRKTRGVDAAVTAGGNWMMAQRLMPTSPPALAFEAAWRTQREIDEYIADARRRHESPSPRVEAVFRAASARIAFAAADLDQAVAQANFAGALDPGAAEVIVAGTRALALELMGVATEAASLPPRKPDWSRLGLSVLDASSQCLAGAMASFRVLDRDGALNALAPLADMPRGASQWTLLAFLRQLDAALWGDPENDLLRIDSMSSVNAIVSREQRYPMAEVLLTRGRLALLERLGHHQAAIELARSLPARWRPAAESCALLWAGRPDEAARIAAGGLFEGSTMLADRLQLLVNRAAGLALDQAASPVAVEQAAAAALGACRENDHWLAVGLLPTEARCRLLEQVAADAVPELIRSRLAGLPDYQIDASARVVLTRRERVLLPMLAGSESVPEIAASLHVSANTVRKQVVSLRAKLGAGSRAELVRLARRAGLL